MICLTSCDSTPTDEITQNDNSNSIDTIEKMINVDGVISIKKQNFSSRIKGAVAYKILYESQNGKLAADVVLPEDYSEENKNYKVLIYFPEISTYIDSLAVSYALNDIIVIRPYSRGYDDSEGVRDLGGTNDLEDAKKLLEIFNSAEFIKKSKIFVAGSSEGSINALRLFAEDESDRISGCAIVDSITDLHSYGISRGEGVQNVFKGLIGNSYEEAAEEYDLRSAVKFSHKLNKPLLILHYLKNPLFNIEQPDKLYELLKNSDDCTYHKIDELSADFQGESLQRLLSWMNKYD